MTVTVRRGRPSTQLEIERWLIDLLSAGSRQANAIFQAGELRGYSARSLHRVKRNLRIDAVQKNRVWYWRDPQIPEAAEPEDLQKKILHKMNEIERKVQLPRVVTEDGVAPQIRGQVDGLGYSKDAPQVAVRQMSPLDIISRVKELLETDLEHDEIARQVLDWAYPASGLPESAIIAIVGANRVIVKPKSQLFPQAATSDVSF